MNSRTAGVGTGVLLLGLWICIGRLGADQAIAQQAPTITSETCLTCHDTVNETRPHKNHSECQSCHSGGAAHVDTPEIKIGLPAATQCLSCHGPTMKGTWSFGQHARAEVACSSCHTIHVSRTPKGLEGRGKRIDHVSATCASCHTDVMARFRLPSHHPVTEGAMSCTSCHDPHSGDRTEVRNLVDRCGSCHQAQRGPKAIVHPPVAESCSTCHSPHGSPNRRLLSMAQPTLCIQCHSVADNRHAVGAAARGALSGAVLRQCTNCHKAIHGGQMDPHLRY